MAVNFLSSSMAVRRDEDWIMIYETSIRVEGLERYFGWPSMTRILDSAATCHVWFDTHYVVQAFHFSFVLFVAVFADQNCIEVTYLLRHSK